MECSVLVAGSLLAFIGQDKLALPRGPWYGILST